MKRAASKNARGTVRKANGSKANDGLPLDLPSGPDFSREQKIMRRGVSPVAGCDEAGRGPLAGPVVAAAVILDPEKIPAGLNDSKQLTKLARETLFEEICATAHIAICSISARFIDRSDIRKASLEAMRRAVLGLAIEPRHVLVDGRDLPVLPCEGDAVIGGDGLSVSIAAASIIAKVTRDRMMERVGIALPAYGFEAHMGYGTKKHRDAITAHGPCAYHRLSFSPFTIDLP
jgi:ribonuclease HII